MLLLFGAIINAALALVCSTMLRFQSGGASSKVLPEDAGLTWLAEEGWKRPDNSGIASQFLLQRHLNAGACYRIFQEKPAFQRGIGPRTLSMEVDAGWPARSFWGGNIDRSPRGDIRHDWRWSDSPQPDLPTFCRSNCIWSIDVQRGLSPLIPNRLVPLKPIWPGFAVNTLFYATILWLIFFAPGAIRRMFRRRRHQCPACGYPIGVSPMCTECGKPLPVCTESTP